MNISPRCRGGIGRAHQKPGYVCVLSTGCSQYARVAARLVGIRYHLLLSLARLNPRAHLL
jgi:hypothetical protein